MKLIKLILFSLSLLSASAHIVAAEAKSVAQSEKQFVYCAEASPLTFNPQLATDNVSFAFSRPIFNQLLAFEFGGTKVVAGLAEKWTLSSDGKVITFNLRKGVKFHSNDIFKPSRDLNADDVLFTFNRMRDPENPYHLIGGGEFKYFKSMQMDKAIRDIQKVNDYEVRFILSRPEATILPNLAMEFTSIMSKEYADALLKLKKPQLFDEKPIGTGPFSFRSYKKDKEAIFDANKSYFRGSPKADSLKFTIDLDPASRVAKLRAMECHMIGNPKPADLPGLREDKNVRIISQPGLNIFYLAFNTSKKPFNDLNFRKAVNHAINKEKIIKEVFGGLAQVAKNPIPPNLWSYDRKVQDLDYNTEKALKYLGQVKLPKDFTVQLSYMPVTRPYNPDGLRVGQLMKADLESVGLKVNLVTKDWKDYLKAAYEGDFELLQSGWTSDNGDPDNFLNLLLTCSGVDGGNNYSRWCDSEYSHAISRALVTTDIRRRTVFYEKAQQIFKNQVPWVTLAHAQIFKATLKNVEGYQTNPFGHDHFDQVRLKTWK